MTIYYYGYFFRLRFSFQPNSLQSVISLNVTAPVSVKGNVYRFYLRGMSKGEPLDLTKNAKKTWNSLKEFFKTVLVYTC